MVNKSLFSSEKNYWETPQNFFDELNEHFYFNWDLAATNENKKCENFFSEQDNSLEKNWNELDGWLWCNPPYGRNIKEWVKKASESEANIVMLIPARTDTTYWHDYIFDKAKIIFLRGRLKFELNGEAKDAAPFPSALVIFKNK